MAQTAFRGIIKIHEIVYEVAAGNESTVRWSKEIGGELELVPFRKRGAPTDLIRVARAYLTLTGIQRTKKLDLISMIPHFVKPVTC